MKICIRLVLLTLVSFPVFAQSSIVNFVDSNFENSLRRNLERGRIYLPNYTGSDYQFTESDLANVNWLDLDESDLTIASLEDLKWFTNLQGLFLWDASGVSDFSPVWGRSEQLEYLAINGSRDTDLSGISDMNGLVYLDLDDNQLTDLSILGNHPNLMDLHLVGNFLDLSDYDVRAKIDSISSQIAERVSSQEYWWTGYGVEYEPQFPSGFRNLSSESSRIDAILASSPNDAEANLLRGLYTLLNIMESTEASGLKEFAVSVGVDPAIRDFVLSDLPALESYNTELNTAFQLGKLAEMMESSIIPSLESADLSFSKVPDSSVVELSQEITGWEDLVNIDNADVLVLRSITNILAGLAALQSSYDWDMTAGHMEELDETGLLDAEQIRSHNPNFGGIRSASQLAKSKAFFQKAIDLYREASPMLLDYNRWDVPNHLFVLSYEDLEDEAKFRDALLDVEGALSGPYVLDEDSGERIDLSRLFSGQVDLANLMPENRKNKFTTDQLDDPTMGGLLPDLTQRRVSEEIEEADLLWENWTTYGDIGETASINLQEGYYTGGSATQVSEGKYVLSGSASSESNLVKMPPELLPIIGDDPAGNSFLFIDEAEDVVGIEGKVMLPSTNSIDSGVYISLWDAFPLESIGIKLVKTEDDKASLRFESDENGYAQDISIPAQLDQNYTLRVTHRLGKSTFFVDGEEVGELRTGSTPDYWGFGAFNKEGLSDYNGTVSDIKILNKYPVAEYSKALAEDSNGNSVALLSNDNDFSWGLDLNGTTLWSVSPDLSYQRFKYEFKGDYVTRTTINQWDDNEIEEVLKLPYSISEDGVLFIEGAPHGDEYLNLIGIDENGAISAKYGSSKKESEYKEFTQFSYPIATEDNKAMTLQISDNGEVVDTFAIVDENNNTQMIFDSTTDVIEFLKVQEDNAPFQKWVQLTNDPVIDALEYYAVENYTTDFFYMDEDHSIESYQSIAFDEVTQGPLSFKKFKGTTVDGITHYSRNGVSNYSITTSSDNNTSSISLATEFKNTLWEKDLKELATSYAYQLDAEGFSVEINQGQKNDHGLDYIAINGSYLNNYNEKINSYYILVDLNQNYSDTGEYWLYASLSGSQEPLHSSTYEDALDIAMSLNFNDSWQQSKVSLDDFTQSSDSTSTTDDQEAEYDSGISVPFAVTSYSETSGWYNSEWFGDFFQSSNGWIFHLDFGWLYPGTSSEPDSCWMYGEKFGWIWIDSYYFPLFYSDVKEGWIYFFKDTDPSASVKNHFYDYTNQEWFGEKNLFEKEEIEEKNTQNQLDWLSSEIQKYW